MQGKMRTQSIDYYDHLLHYARIKVGNTRERKHNESENWQVNGADSIRCESASNQITSGSIQIDRDLYAIASNIVR